MQILSVQPLRGPNLWSISIPLLIQVKLDFIDEQSMSVDALENLFERAKENCPFLSFNANLSVAQQLTIATSEMAIYLQKKAGFKLHYIANKPTIIAGVYNAVFEYQNESIGVEAIHFAGELINLIIESKDIKQLLHQSIEDLMRKKNELDIHLQNLIEACDKAQIPYCLPDDELPFHLGYGKNGMEIAPKDYQNTIAQLPKHFKNKTEAIIPIIAITGSNGKTTTTRLIAHILQAANYSVGYTTSDGIYVEGLMIDKGDTTGPYSAKLVLRNPKVEVAVLESARGGIVRAGLGFMHCDLAVVTNVQNDHLGISDIETMEELAQVKQVIVNAVKTDGFAILNADNAYTLQMGKQAKCKVAWFSSDVTKNTLVSQTNIAAYVEQGKVYFHNNDDKTFIMEVNEIPITFNGSLDFMTQNALAAILACLIFGIEPKVIAKAVACFYPGEALTPGRMNIYQFKQCEVMVDFAHNPEGFMGIAAFLKSYHAKYKIGIIVGTGDRKEEDIKLLGKISASMFDHVLIHQVKFLRGQTADRLVSLLVDGMKEENLNISWQRVPDEAEPLLFALQMINTENSMIVALSDVLDEPAALVKKYREEY